MLKFDGLECSDPGWKIKAEIRTQPGQVMIRLVTSSLGKMDNRIETVATSCPYCGYKIEQVSHVPFDEFVFPRKHDLSVCIKCQNILVFSDNVGHVRKPTGEELSDALNDSRVWRLLEAMKKLRGLKD